MRVPVKASGRICDEVDCACDEAERVAASWYQIVRGIALESPVTEGRCGPGWCLLR